MPTAFQFRNALRAAFNCKTVPAILSRQTGIKRENHNLFDRTHCIRNI
jgi:hypothetical protein